MVKSYEIKLFNPTISFQGSNQKMVNYLNKLWSDDALKEQEVKVEFKELPNEVNLENFKNTLSKVSENLIFRGNFGAYDDILEKECSLSKKSILINGKQTKELYLCLNDLIRYNSIRPSLFDNIKDANIFIKHKKGDNQDPKNFRFLSCHNNCFKILDKFWTNNLINVLKKNNSLPDKNIVTNNFDREFTVSIRDLALDKLAKFKNGTKIVLLDIKKAFDSVSWDILKVLLIRNLTRKINKKFAEKVVEQYMFLNSKRSIKFNSIPIKFNKSIGTGLPSSTIVFSLLIEQIIFEWLNKEDCRDKLLINTFVDDMYLEFKDITNCYKLVESLIKYLNNYNLVINKDKTKTNIKDLPYSQINESDCYLGLPFSVIEKNYISECIEMFKVKYYDIEVDDIIDILESEEYIKVKREILGFFNYKLYGLKHFGKEEINVLSILKNYKLL